MTSRYSPRYPIYVISKGRADACLTARFLLRDDITFRLVIEPQERDAYAANFPDEILEILPFSNLGLGSIPARNWVWEHALTSGADRHWILDDNIRQFHRLYEGQRIPCASAPAFATVEDFTDRYANIGLSGMNYHMFGIKGSPPFRANVHVYSCLLLQNSLPFRWRGRYNEDTDLCLQVLAAGLCTVAVNAFLAEKMPTMTMKGGNTEDLYKDDGRLKMARALERMWPGIVTVDRRFQRPQHVVNWQKFDTPLRFREGVSLDQFTQPNEYGLKIREVRPVKSPSLRKLLDK